MISINPYEIILQIVNFGILYFLLKKFLAKPLSEFLSNRANSIKHNLEHAEITKKKAEDTLNENKELLKTAQLDAQAIRKRAEEASKKELKSIIDAGQEQSSQLIEQAKKDIEQQTNNARKKILEDTGSLVVKVVSKYISTSVSKEDQQSTIDNLVNQVSKK